MKSTLKRVGIVVVILIGVILLGNLILYTLGESRLKHVYSVPKEAINIPIDEDEKRW